jgi:hypothetical protein
MLEYLAKTYPVDSIALTRLLYDEEGYGLKITLYSLLPNYNALSRKRRKVAY